MDSSFSSTDDATLIVVSNRLPVSVIREEGKTGPDAYTFRASSGGLTTALSGLISVMPFTWIGWAGLEVPEEDQAYVTDRLVTEFNCVPVFLEAETADLYYNGFSNSTLWPLFHYHPVGITFDETSWDAYRQVNLQFAEVIYSQVSTDDLVWVQDYHLCLVPLYLRFMMDGDVSLSKAQAHQFDKPPVAKEESFDPLSQAASSTDDLPAEINPNNVYHSAPVDGNIDHDLFNCLSGLSITPHDFDDPTRVTRFRIGYFLHVPFPTSEVFRVLPVRKEILRGILSADLVGFHTYDYARHFLSSVENLLGLPCFPNRVIVGSRRAHIGTFPIGIDPRKFSDGLAKPNVQERIAYLKSRFQGLKVLVGVDRLDYIKGVPQKLQALESLLEDHLEWVGKLLLVQVAVPSRGDVEEYQNLRAMVNEMVGRINGRFCNVDYMPIHFMHKSVSFDELCALYAISDVCVVSSSRDGMNLVSYEYIACQRETHGTLVLSEFAGASHSLNGSLIVNPWNISEFAETLLTALEMSPDTRKANYQKLSRYVDKYTAQNWGFSFVNELQRLFADDSDAPLCFNKLFEKRQRRMYQRAGYL